MRKSINLLPEPAKNGSAAKGRSFENRYIIVLTTTHTNHSLGTWKANCHLLLHCNSSQVIQLPGNRHPAIVCALIFDALLA